MAVPAGTKDLTESILSRADSWHHSRSLNYVALENRAATELTTPRPQHQAVTCRWQKTPQHLVIPLSLHLGRTSTLLTGATIKSWLIDRHWSRTVSNNPKTLLLVFLKNWTLVYTIQLVRDNEFSYFSVNSPELICFIIFNSLINSASNESLISFTNPASIESVISATNFKLNQIDGCHRHHRTSSA